MILNVMMRSSVRAICLFFMIILFPMDIFAKDYIIGDGDTLRISVWGSEELSLDEVIVRPDGKISLPALGEVRASGLTTTELKNALEKGLTHLVKKPIVTVIVTHVMNYQIVVFGNGATPGIHALQKQTTLLEFLSRLGALESADLEGSHLFRDKKKIMTGFYELFRNGDLSKDIELEPNDILFIPDNYKKRVSIVGAVTSPTVIPYKEGLTILDIILSAEGFTEFADKNDVEILRTMENNERKKVKVRAKDLLKGDLERNVNIMPGDVVVVKESLF